MLDYEVVGKVILRLPRQFFKLQRCIRATVTCAGKLEIECKRMNRQEHRPSFVGRTTVC